MTVWHFGSKEALFAGLIAIYASGSWTAIFDRLSGFRPAKRSRHSPAR
jgi:hypothetical protein